MELQDKPLDPKESLQLIQRFISGARYDVRKSAFGFIFWGILIAAAALLNYLLVAFTSFASPWLPWPVLMIGGFVFTMICYRRAAKRRGTISNYGYFFKWLFLCGGLIYFLMAFLCTQQGISPMPFMMALTSLLVGVSGFVLRYRPLIWGGVLFFLAAIAGVFLSGQGQLLLMVISILAGYMVPGILLTRGKDK
jgi:hypothetical protein